MNLQKKLAEIRQKPAHIRLRYTYTAVAISMFFILMLWFFSLVDTLKKSTPLKKQNVFEGTETQKKSLKDATLDIKKSINASDNTLKNVNPENNQPLE